MKRKTDKITDQKEMKKPLEKMKSLGRFTKNGTVLNENRINMLKRLQVDFSLPPVQIYRKVKLCLPTGNSGRLNVPSEQ